MRHGQLRPPRKSVAPIVHINNAAVNLIEDGDFVSASRLLSGALHMLLTREVETSHTLKRPREMHYSWSKNAPIAYRPTDEECIGTYVYLRGMFIVERSRKTSAGSTVLPLGEAKAVIIYNAALSAHLLSLALSDSALLRKAQSLYSLSFSILRKRQAARAPTSRLSHGLFFHMAVLNNLGRAAYELANFKMSGTCFAQLKLNLKVFFFRKMNSQLLYCDSDLHGMISNTVLEMPVTAPCA